MSDDDPTSTSSQFTATVDWGDGSSSKETFHGGSRWVIASAGHHYYAGRGPYTYTVTINDVGGASTTTSGIISASTARRGRNV